MRNWELGGIARSADVELFVVLGQAHAALTNHKIRSVYEQGLIRNKWQGCEEET